MRRRPSSPSASHCAVFRHYSIIATLVNSVPASATLLLHMRPIGPLAATATVGAITVTAMGPLRVQLVANAGAALVYR